MSTYYDVLVQVFNGKALTGGFLQNLPIRSLSLQYNQLGGIGQATYELATEQSSATMANIQVPNRIDCYLKQSILTASISSGAVACNASHPGQFAVGDTIALWDGQISNVANITGISGTLLSLDASTTHNYSSTNTTITKLMHRGMIQNIDYDANLKNVQKITVQSYFNELLNLALANGQFAKYECGSVLYDVLLGYTSEVDLIVNSGNIVQSSVAIPGTPSGGTGQVFTANYTSGTQFSNFITDIINSANGNASNVASSTPVIYSCYIDVHNKIYFKVVNETTTTWTYGLNTYANDPYNIGLFDIASDYKHHQDSTQLVNQYLLTGGNYSTSQQTPTQAIVYDSTSIGRYGIREKIATISNITDIQTLTACGQGMLSNSAYPIDSFSLITSPTLHFAIPNIDYIQITGFADSSSVRFPVISTQIDWRAENFGQFTQTISGGGIRPNISGVLSAVQNQSALDMRATTTGNFSSLQDRFVVSGCSPSFSGNVFSISAGVFQAQVGQVVSSQNYYTDIGTDTPNSSASQLQLTLNSAVGDYFYVSLTNVNTGGTRTFNVSGSYSGTDSGGQRAYGLLTTFTYYNSSETATGTWFWTVSAGSANARWFGTHFWRTAGVNKSAGIDALQTTLTQFAIPQTNITCTSGNDNHIAFWYRNQDGSIKSSPQFVNYVETYVPPYAPYTDYQIAPFYIVGCSNGGYISNYNDVRNVAGVQNNHLMGNPNPSIAPQYAVIPASLSYVASGQGAYGCATNFTLTQGILPWLSELRCYAVLHGVGSGGSRSSVFDLAPASNGHYIPLWSGLSPGVQYDLYCCFVDNASVESTPLFVGTTSANAMAIVRSNMSSMPSGTTPSPSSISIGTPLVNGSSVDVPCNFNTDSLGYTTSAWIAGLVLWSKKIGQPASAWSVVSMVQAIPSGAYSVIYNAQDVAGFDLGYSYEDLAGNYSAVAYLGSCSASTIAHTAQSTGVQAVVSSTGTVNINPSGGVSGNLPYPNNASQITGVIGSGTSLNVSPSGGVSNTLPYVNHASGVTNVIGSSGDYDASKARTGTNLPYNSNSLGALASFTSFGQLYGIGATWNASAGIGGATSLNTTQITTVTITLPSVSGTTPQYVVFCQLNNGVYNGSITINASGSALSSIDTLGQYTDVLSTSGHPPTNLITTAYIVCTSGSLSINFQYTPYTTAGGATMSCPSARATIDYVRTI